MPKLHLLEEQFQQSQILARMASSCGKDRKPLMQMALGNVTALDQGIRCKPGIANRSQLLQLAFFTLNSLYNGLELVLQMKPNFQSRPGPAQDKKTLNSLLQSQLSDPAVFLLSVSHTLIGPQTVEGRGL
ncbi:hypothetical protein GH733_001973 [Mirounga leonina]|nr:hypothetical protein GH733_001973 [Mirounga leonina]